MNPSFRSSYNANFRLDRYLALVEDANHRQRWPTDFRIAETPLFLTPEFTREVAGAARALVAQLQTPEFARHAADAIPAGLSVPARRRIRFSCRSISPFAPPRKEN